MVSRSGAMVPDYIPDCLGFEQLTHIRNLHVCALDARLQRASMRLSRLGAKIRAQMRWHGKRLPILET